MQCTQRHFLTWLTATGLLLIAGCSTSHFRYETVVHSDGTFDRAIYQPDLEDESDWDIITAAAKVSHDDWDGSITELPAITPDEDHPYVAAWGHFDSIEAIPKHFEIKSPDESRSSKLVREYSRTDYGFVVEHRWSEKLTDIVTHDDMHTAANELADLLISLGEEVVDEAFQGKYDTSELVGWLKTEGKAWLIEICDIYWDIAARGPDRDEIEKELPLALATCCTRHGLKLTDENGEILRADFETVIAAFVDDKIRGLVRGPQGEAIDSATVDAVLVGIDMGLRSSNDEAVQAKVRHLKEVGSRVVEKRFGSDEAFEAHWGSLLARIIGLYGVFGGTKDFGFRLRVPGMIVQSNGEQQSDHSVAWRFDGTEVFPYGYHMTCRSLEADEEALSQMLSKNPLSDRKSLLSFVKLAGADKEIQDTLIRCRDDKSLAAFDERLFELQVDPDSNRDELQRMLKLRRLLLSGR